MKVEVSETIQAPRSVVWDLITDPDGWEENISGIKSVEVLERPQTGLVGLKWKETRIMFGKEAHETMWISAAESGIWYETSAENHGARYNTRVSLEEAGGSTEITMRFSATPTTFASRMMTAMSFLFSGSIRKALSGDLADIRKAAESRAGSAAPA